MADFCRDTIAWMRANQIGNVAGGKLKRTANGTTIEVSPVPKVTRGTAATGCIFGQIVPVPDTDPQEYAIRGGVIYCGDKNFNVENYVINIAPDRERMVQIKITGIKPNMDDDEEVILPGIETAAGTPAWEEKSGTVYDDNTNPTIAATGTVIIPIGKLVIDDEVASLTNVGCGNVRVSQCAGILTVDRL